MNGGGQRRQGRLLGLATCAFGLAWSASSQATGLDLSRVNLDVALSSDYVVHGVSRSGGEPSAQAQMAWNGESGWIVGAWLATVNMNPGPGPTLEIDPYLARRFQWGNDWSLRADVTRYLFRRRLEWAPYDYTELRTGLSWRDTIDVAIAWAPDYSGFSRWGPSRHQSMFTYEGAARFPATRWLTFNGGLGYREMRDAYGAGYWYWSGGAEASVDRVSFAVAYIATSSNGRELFGYDNAGNRVVATLALRLR